MTRIDAAIRHLHSALEHLYKIEEERGETHLELGKCRNRVNAALHQTATYAKDNHERINQSETVSGRELAQARPE